MMMLSGAAQPFYVDPINGRDTYNGSLATPFQTIGKAQTAVRLVNASMSSDIYVYLMGADHFQTSTLNFTQVDRGYNGYKVIYKAYGNHKPIINGGKQVTGWSLVAGQKYYVADVPTGANGFASYFRQIWVNGKRCVQAKSDFINVYPKPFDNTATTQVSDGIIVKKNAIKNYTNLSDIRIFQDGKFKHVEQQVNSIANISDSEQVLMMKNSNFDAWTTTYVYDNTKQIQVLNAFEELDEPGEFYLNRTTRKLYYYPEPGENILTAEVFAPTVEYLVKLTGTSSTMLENIQFEGIAFKYGNWTGPNLTTKEIGRSQADLYSDYTSFEGQLSMIYSQNITIKNCRFEYLASSGIYLNSNNNNITIEGNVFRDLTAAAVIIGGGNSSSFTFSAVVNRDILIKNNVIRNIGADFYQSSGIYANITKNLSIIHNDVADVAYFGINQRYGNSIAEITSTSAVAYTGNTLIQYNKVSNFGTAAKLGMGIGDEIAGIYFFGVRTSKVQYNYVTYGGKDEHLEGAIRQDQYGCQNYFEYNVADCKPAARSFSWYDALNTQSDTLLFANNYANVVGQFRPTAKADTVNFFYEPSAPSWSSGAQSIIDNAGLEPAYQYLLDELGNGINMAKTASISSSSDFSTSFPSSNIADEKIATNWKPAQGNESSGSWIQLSFPQPIAIHKLQLVPEYNNANPEIRQLFEVWLSNDPNFSTYNILGGQNEKPFPYKISFLDNDVPIAYNTFDLLGNDTLGYQYIRIVGRSMSWAECRVYGRNQSFVPNSYSNNSNLVFVPYTSLTIPTILENWSQKVVDTSNSSRAYFGSNAKYWNQTGGMKTGTVTVSGGIANLTGGTFTFKGGIHKNERTGFKIKITETYPTTTHWISFRASNVLKGLSDQDNYLISIRQLTTGAFNTNFSIERRNKDATIQTFYGLSGSLGGSIQRNSTLFSDFTTVVIETINRGTGLGIVVRVGSDTVFNFIDNSAKRVTTPGYFLFRPGNTNGTMEITDIPVTGAIINPSIVQIQPTETLTLLAYTIPDNATIQLFSWKSNNPAVATVNALGEVTGVALGTTTITATSQEGNFVASATVNVVNPITYTWTGATNLDFQQANNWTPTRNVINDFDILQFTASPAGIISNVPNQTIRQLILSGSNTVVNLQPATGYVSGVNANRTLTIGNNFSTDDDILIPNGCELILANNSFGTVALPSVYAGDANDRDKISNGLTLAFAGNASKVNIAGKLTIERTATFTLPSIPTALAAATYSLGQYVFLNQNLYAITTAGTTANATTVPTPVFGNTATNGTAVLTYIGSVLNGIINGTSQYGSFTNTLNLLNAVATVGVNGTIENKSTALLNATSTNLIFSNGANYIFNREDANTNIPTVTDMSGVNLNINGIVSSSFTAFIPLPVAVKSLTWNTPNITSGANVRVTAASGTSLAIAGNVSFTLGTTTGNIGPLIGNPTTVNIGGNLSITSANVYTGRGTADWTVAGNLTLNSGSLTVLDGLYSFGPSITSNITVNGNLNILGTSTLRLNNLNAVSGSLFACNANLMVKGNFTKVSGSTFTTTTNSGQIGNIIFNGSSPQTIDATGGFTNNPNVEINNSNGVALNGSAVGIGTLTLTNGILTNANRVTVTNTTTPIIGGSSSAYVSGALAITYPLGATNITNVFPVGKGGNYRPLGFRYNSVSGTSIVTVEQLESAITTGTLTTPVNPFNSRYWTISQTGGTSPNFTITLDATGFSPNSGSSLRMIQTNGTTGNSYAVNGSAPNYTNSTAFTSFLSGTNSFGFGENNIPTTTTVASLTSIPYGTSSVSLNATVANANPGAGASVTFRVNGSIVGTAPTNTSGLATLMYNTASLAVGTYTVTATVGGIGVYLTSTSAAVSLVVNAIAPTIGAFNAINKNFGDAPFALTAPTSNSAGTFSYSSSNTSVATIIGNTVTIVGVGTSTITATQSASGFYTVGTSTAVLTVSTTSYTWTGSINSNWSTANNWQEGVVPPSGSDIIIGTGLTNYPVLQANTTIRKCTIQAGGSLSLNGFALTINDSLLGSGNFIGSPISSLQLNGAGTLNMSQQSPGNSNTLATLTINAVGTVSVSNPLNIKNTLNCNQGILASNGNLVLLASAAGVASVPTIGGVITGNVTAQLFIPAKTARKYSFIGSPVGNVLVSNSWQKQVYITGAGTGGVICGAGNTAFNSNGFDRTQTNTPSLYVYNAQPVNGTRWATIPNTNATPLEQGKGYRINIRGDRNLGNCANQLNSNTPAAPVNVVLEATGSLSQGNLSVPLLDTTYSKYTLLANPYPCAIGFTAMQADNASIINNKMWTYSPYGNGNYTTYSAGLISNPATGYNNTNGDWLAVGQAFFVEAKRNGSLLLKETHKTNNAIPNFQYFGSGNAQIVRIGLKNDKDSLMDEAVLRFNTNGSSQYLPDWDAHSMSNADQALAILKGIRKLAIGTFSDAPLFDTIRLSIASNRIGNFQLKCTDFGGITNRNILLYDRYLQQYQSINSNPVYQFQITSDTQSLGTNRFALLLQPPTTLPTLFTNLIARWQQENAISIHWKLANNAVITTMEVQRSDDDGHQFHTIATLKPNNTTEDYRILDTQLSASVSNYRYRIVGIQPIGQRIYSQTVTISRKQNTQYPISITSPSGQLQIAVQIRLKKPSIVVYNLAGQKCYVKTYPSIPENAVLPIPSSPWAKGMYSIQIFDDGERIWTGKWVKVE